MADNRLLWHRIMCLVWDLAEDELSFGVDFFLKDERSDGTVVIRTCESVGTSRALRIHDDGRMRLVADSAMPSEWPPTVPFDHDEAIAFLRSTVRDA